MKNTTCLIFCMFLSFCAVAQPDPDALALRHARATFDEFKEMLALANDAHYPEDIEKNVQWCEAAFPRREFTTQRLATATAPLLLAERKSRRSGAPTVLAYLQMDGQPVDPSFWHQESPWKAVLKKQVPGEGWVEIPWESLRGELNPEWRIFARAASDAKGPVMMFLAAMDALASLGEDLPYHLKVIIDFEEELGSPQLPKAVETYRRELAAEALVIFDGPPHISNEPTLSFGARGIADVTLTVFGPTFLQHSGHYGNYCPNPALRLAQLLAGMKDEHGRVTIPGFYDGIVFDEKTKAEMAQVPDDEQFIRSKLGVATADRVAGTYQEALQYPSLNIRGMASGWVGEEVRTIIPATATAEIDVRLVMESDPERLIGLIRKYIEDQGYVVLDRQPDSRERLSHDKICRFDYSVSYKAFRTEFDSETGIWLTKALTKAFGKAPLKIRTAGGSIPISPFVTTLGIPAVAVPTVNPDNNQHSPNENIRIGNYVDGVKTILAVLREPLK
ncbi:MAG: M20/M25/M40 family metallo-hydrolase [Saprospiraceae bacterium]|nr:M20/M25/M40 family metallo-hydrolase [Saprospiraceae bacterium]